MFNKERIEEKKKIKSDIKDLKKAMRFAEVMERMCIKMFIEEKNPDKGLRILDDMKEAARIKMECKEIVEGLKKELKK